MYTPAVQSLLFHSNYKTTHSLTDAAQYAGRLEGAHVCVFSLLFHSVFSLLFHSVFSLLENLSYGRTRLLSSQHCYIQSFLKEGAGSLLLLENAARTCSSHDMKHCPPIFPPLSYMLFHVSAKP